MQRNEAQKYFIFKRDLIIQGAQSHSLHYKKCKFYFDQENNAIDFSLTLLELQKRHPSLTQTLKNTQLFYIDEVQQKNHFLGNHPLEQQVQVEFNNWQGTSITISCRDLIQKTKLNPQKQIQTGRKSKEKTIAQVISCIEEWQKQFEKSQQNQKRLSKIGAAKNIGINKKTLEDYRRCLKLGEKYGFDFQHQSRQKISVLRKFVKEQRTEDIDIYWQKDEFITKKKHEETYD